MIVHQKYNFFSYFSLQDFNNLITNFLTVFFLLSFLFPFNQVTDAMVSHEHMILFYKPYEHMSNGINDKAKNI